MVEESLVFMALGVGFFLGVAVTTMLKDK